MSFLGDLFGSSDTAPPPAPAPLQATPTIADAVSQSAALEERSRLGKRMGVDKTILTPEGLGDTSYSPSNISRTSALGSGASSPGSTAPQ